MGYVTNYEFRKEEYFCRMGLTRFCKTAGVLPVVSLGQQWVRLCGKIREIFGKPALREGQQIDLAFWRRSDCSIALCYCRPLAHILGA
jgi:hypothetical protein